MTETRPYGEVEVSVAFGADLAAASGTWTWTDVTADVLEDPGISIRWGRSDEAARPQPTEIRLELRNETGAYSLGGESPHWPHVAAGTPVRVRIDPDAGGWHILALGYAASWAPGWTIDGRTAVMRLTASGIMRRLAQGRAPQPSSLRRGLENHADTVAYWPMEEGPNSNAFAAAVGPHWLTWDAAAPPDLAAADIAACSRPVATIDGAVLTGWTPPYTGTGEITVSALIEMGSSDPAGVILSTRLVGGTLHKIDVEYDGNGNLDLVVYDTPTSVLDLTGPIGFGLDEFPTVRRLYLEIVQDGSDVDVTVGTLAPATGAAGVAFLTLPSEGMGGVNVVACNTAGATDPAGALTGMAIGHLAVQNAAVGTSDLYAEVTAWRGEQAYARLERLAAETGEVLTIAGDADTALGPQPIAGVLESFQNAADAEGGVLLDGIGGSGGLSHIARDVRLSRPADLTLGIDELVPPWEPVRDDAAKVNRAEVTRAGAGTHVALDQADIDLAGTYETSKTVNVYFDIQAQREADWLVWLGTASAERYPSVTIDHRAAPGHGADVADLYPGTRLDVTGASTDLVGHPAGTVELIVEGAEHRLTASTWVTSLNASPARPWLIAHLEDDPGRARLDTEGSELDAGASAAATSIDVATLDGPLWTTDSGDYPLTLEVGGIPVTASACSGASSPQTFTVSALPVARTAGMPVRLWRPGVIDRG